MDNIFEVLEEKTKNMRITRSIQTGFLNIKMTELLASLGDVYLYTPASFNPFEENKKVVLTTTDEPNHFARSFKNKNGYADIVVLSGNESYGDLRAAISAFMPNIRLNGLMLITNTEDESLRLCISDYVEQVGSDFFEITNYDTFTLVVAK